MGCITPQSDRRTKFLGVAPPLASAGCRGKCWLVVVDRAVRQQVSLMALLLASASRFLSLPEDALFLFFLLLRFACGVCGGHYLCTFTKPPVTLPFVGSVPFFSAHTALTVAAATERPAPRGGYWSALWEQEAEGRQHRDCFVAGDRRALGRINAGGEQFYLLRQPHSPPSASAAPRVLV